MVKSGKIKKDKETGAFSLRKTLVFCLLIGGIALGFVWKKAALDEAYRLRQKLNEQNYNLKAELIEVKIVCDKETSFPVILEKAKAMGFNISTNRPRIVNLSLNDLPHEFFREYQASSTNNNAD
ncbi:hypothetical protein ISS30_00245 [bacterium]|nr:hypothetical protein [bacterium]